MAHIDTHHSSALNAILHPAATSTKSVFAAIWHRIKAALERAQNQRKLRHMPPHILRDIGLSESDIAQLQVQREFGNAENLETIRMQR